MTNIIASQRSQELGTGRSLVEMFLVSFLAPETSCRCGVWVKRWRTNQLSLTR